MPVEFTLHLTGVELVILLVLFAVHLMVYVSARIDHRETKAKLDQAEASLSMTLRMIDPRRNK